MSRVAAPTEIAQRLRALGIKADPDGAVIKVTAGQRPILFNVVAASTPQAVPSLPEGQPTILVADRLSERIRADLDRSGVGWLDRRGHLRVRHEHLIVDVDFEPDAPTGTGKAVDPLRGEVTASVAMLALAKYPDSLPGVRETARILDVTPGGVSHAVKRLTDGNLLTAQRRAAVPGLFNAVSRSWEPTQIALADPPDPTDPDNDFVIAGGHAGDLLGAPVIVQQDAPLELIARDSGELRRLRRRYPEASSITTAAAVVMVAPAPIGLTGTEDRTLAGYDVASEPVVALTLALDRARGAEILNGWEFDDRPW